MDTLDKLNIFNSDAVPKDKAIVETLSTSIKITCRCGCIMVEHFCAGEPDYRPDESAESRMKRRTNRKYFVELCNVHKKTPCQKDTMPRQN